MNYFFQTQTIIGSQLPKCVASCFHCSSGQLHLVCPQSAKVPFDDGNSSHYPSHSICLGLLRWHIIIYAAWSLQFWKPSKIGGGHAWWVWAQGSSWVHWVNSPSEPLILELCKLNTVNAKLVAQNAAVCPCFLVNFTCRVMKFNCTWLLDDPLFPQAYHCHRQTCNLPAMLQLLSQK